MGQGDGVVVELEGVGVGKGDGENRHVLIVVKTGKHLISRKKYQYNRTTFSETVSFSKTLNDLTFGKLIRVERNSRTGIAICTVAEIFDRFSKTFSKPHS